MHGNPNLLSAWGEIRTRDLPKLILRAKSFSKKESVFKTAKWSSFSEQSFQKLITKLRSAVLAQRSEHLAALRDISRAIATNKYPRHLNVKILWKRFILIDY